MNNKFDELTKQMAQSVTRRGALKKFSIGLAGMALACFGLANKVAAGKVVLVSCKKCIDYCMGGGLSQQACHDQCRQKGLC